MKKEIYLIKETGNESYQQFSNRILSIAASVSNEKDVVQLKVVLTSDPPPKISVIPFKKEKIAVISVFSTKTGNYNLMINEPGFSGGYTVDEAIPVAYEKKWTDGQTTPGVCLLTLFRKKKRINYDLFIDRWHNGHTPLSRKIHPLWNYNRNVVNGKLTDVSFNWDGIVEEHFRTTSDLLNPLKFFGNPLVMVYNILRVYFDTKSFLDYQTIEPYFATEIWIKS
jgi:hypothetical protein